MFLAIELPHVLEKLDFSSIKDRSSVLQCGLSGTIVFSNLAATFVQIRITLQHWNFSNTVINCSDQIFFCFVVYVNGMLQGDMI